jgi:hypothetical protein
MEVFKKSGTKSRVRRMPETTIRNFLEVIRIKKILERRN